MYQPRKYRDTFNRERFRGRRVEVEESDLWIGTDPGSFPALDFSKIVKELERLRNQIKEYIRRKPAFLESLDPLAIDDDDPSEIVCIKESTVASGTGPMAGIAGYFASAIAGYILSVFRVEELIVENGGDISLLIKSPLNLALETGENHHFKNLGLEILPSESLVGICSSSGMFGHSFSYGKADLVMTVSENTILADSWATALANRILTETDVDHITEHAPGELTAILAIKDKKIAYKGKYRLIKIT